MNQHDALFFFLISLPRLYMFRTYFSPSSGGQVYNVAMVLLLLKRLSAVCLAVVYPQSFPFSNSLQIHTQVAALYADEEWL
jgi:hypothetical protein